MNQGDLGGGGLSGGTSERRADGWEKTGELSTEECWQGVRLTGQLVVPLRVWAGGYY